LSKNQKDLISIFEQYSVKYDILVKTNRNLNTSQTTTNNTKFKQFKSKKPHKNNQSNIATNNTQNQLSAITNQLGNSTVNSNNL
jgi:hypothetical protein